MQHKIWVRTNPANANNARGKYNRWMIWAAFCCYSDAQSYCDAMLSQHTTWQAEIRTTGRPAN